MRQIRSVTLHWKNEPGLYGEAMPLNTLEPRECRRTCPHSITIRKSRHIIFCTRKTNHACADCGQRLSNAIHDVAFLPQKSKDHGFTVVSD